MRRLVSCEAGGRRGVDVSGCGRGRVLGPRQAATLLGVGLQHKTIDDLEKDLKLEGRQLLANFNKVRHSLNPTC